MDPASIDQAPVAKSGSFLDPVPSPITSHIIWRLTILFIHLAISLYHLLVLFWTSPYHSWGSYLENLPGYVSACNDFYIYAAQSFAPISVICVGFLTISNPRSLSPTFLSRTRIIESTAAVALFLQPLCCALSTTHDVYVCISYLATLLAYAVIFRRLTARALVMGATFPNNTLQTFVYTTLPAATAGALLAVNYFAAEIVPCIVQFAPQLLIQADEDTDFTDPRGFVTRCEDAATAIYTLQCILTTIFFAAIYIAPFQLRSESTAGRTIAFSYPPRTQICLLLALTGSLLGCFLFGSSKDVLENYDKYIHDHLWHKYTFRSRCNFAARGMMVAAVWGALGINPGADTRGGGAPNPSPLPSPSSPSPRPIMRQLSSSALRLAGHLSARHPIQLAPVYRAFLALTLVGCAVPLLMAIRYAYRDRLDETKNLVLALNSTAVLQPLLVISASLVYISRPLRRSKLDTAVFFYTASHFLATGVTTWWCWTVFDATSGADSSVTSSGNAFVTPMAQIGLGTFFLFTFPVAQECRNYLRTLPPVMAKNFLAVVVATAGAAIPTALYLTSSSFGCISSNPDDLGDCFGDMQANHVVMINIMFNFLVVVNTYTTEVISWEETVTMTGRGGQRYQMVKVLTQSITAVLSAGVFGSSASDTRQFAMGVLRFNSTMWTFCLIVCARHVHKVVAIENAVEDGDEEEEIIGCRKRFKQASKACLNRVLDFSKNYGEEPEKEKSSSSGRQEEEEPAKRISPAYQICLVPPIFLPLAIAIAAIPLNLVRGSARCHHLASCFLLCCDNLFVLQTLCCIVFVFADINKKHFLGTKVVLAVAFTPAAGAILNGVNVNFLEAKEFVVIWTFLPLFVMAISYTSFRHYLKVREFLSQGELNSHILSEVAPAAVSAIPAIIILSSQHLACVTSNFSRLGKMGTKYSPAMWGGGYDDEVFGYYKNQCSEVNFVTKPLLILIFTVTYLRICVAPIQQKSDDVFSMKKLVLMQLNKFSTFRFCMFAMLGVMGVFLYGVGGERREEPTYWIKNIFSAFTAGVGILWCAESLNAISKKARAEMARGERASELGLTEMTPRGGGRRNIKRASVLLGNILESAKSGGKKVRSKIKMGDSATIGGRGKGGGREKKSNDDDIVKQMNFDPGFV